MILRERLRPILYVNSDAKITVQEFGKYSKQPGNLTTMFPRGWSHPEIENILA
jgi:hypothetical protein